MQLGTVGMNALSLAGLCVRMGTAKLPPGLAFDPADVSAFKHTALLIVIGYLLVMGGWATLNYWGLHRRSKIAYVSSIAFAVTCILSCLSSLFGGVLIYLLFKREMKGYFDERPTS